MRDFTNHLLSMADRIARKPLDRGVLSTGELIAVAIVLNKPQWLKEAGHTLSSALTRLGADELSETLIAASVWKEQ